ncbi:MAG: OmpH family outer membrane protein [Planctomycetota bacterium]|nr:OmpH family outer membrane protein [Planctomycetota bacterium]
MRSLRVLLAAALAVGLPLVLAGTVRAELKLGVVDIVEVTNNYDRTKDASADLQVEQANLKAAAEPKAKALEDMRIKRDGFNRGTEEYKKLDDQLLKTEVEFRNWLGLEQIKIERRHRDVLLDMYNEIVKVATRLGREKSLDMVFTKAFLSPPQIDVTVATGLDDLKNRIMGQRVLFPSSVADLTQDVLKTLNAEYKSSKKSAGETKPAPKPAPKG